MLAAVDLFYVLVACCVLAALGLVVCLIGAVVEALRADRVVLAGAPADDELLDDVEGFTILTADELARRASGTSASPTTHPVPAAGAVATPAAAATATPASDEATPTSTPAPTPAPELLPVAATHRRRLTRRPAAPVRVAAVEADRGWVGADVTTPDPAAEARRAIAAAAAESKISDEDRRRREAPTSPVPIVRLTPYTVDAAQVRPAAPARTTPTVGTEAPAVSTAPAATAVTVPSTSLPTRSGAAAPAAPAAPTAPNEIAERPRRQATVIIDAPTASQLAASDVIDLDGERARRTGQVPVVVTAETPTDHASASLPAGAHGARPQPAEVVADQPPAEATPVVVDHGADHDDELGRRRRRARKAARVHHEDTASTGRKLPAGAEAALRSIIEVRPDPRNTLALQRDPTAEVRLTSADRAEAAARARRQPSADDRRSA